MSMLKHEMNDRVLVCRFVESEIADEIKAAKVGEELRSLISEAKTRKMLLDFNGLSRISSVMIGQLFVLKNSCKAADVDLKLCGMSPVIKELLDIVQLTNFVDTYDDEDDAWEAFHQEFDTDDAQDAEGSVDKCRQSAESGDANSQFELATRYDEGNGVEQDTAIAFAWYKKAADQSHAEAQFMVGKSYAYGIHVTQDYGQAVQWYQKAADQGLAIAQYVLGMTCQYGLAGSENKAEAVRWYQKAAEQGHNPARDALSELERNQ